MRRLLTSSIIGLAIIVTVAVKAQSQDVTSWLAQLQSTDPTVRQTGFYGIAKANIARTNDQVKLALIDLLLREEAYAKLQSNGAILNSQGYSDYFSDVVTTVAALRDLRSIDALLGVIGTGNSVGSALASFGVSSLDKVLASSSTNDVIPKFFQSWC